MNKLLLATLFIIAECSSKAQVSLIKADKGLEYTALLNSNKLITVSNIDNTLWVTDATVAGTFQLSPEIVFEGGGVVLNSKLIFIGSTVLTGKEIFVTDGTAAGTRLVKDIFAGTTGSTPDVDMALLNGYVYFTAATSAAGRELWRTDGTEANTTLVKDITTGTSGSNDPNKYHLISTGSYLLFAARSITTGTELYKSDGTAAGTVLLKDIYTGGVSSSPQDFYSFKNEIYFTATSLAYGRELWKTNGTEAGTVLVKDINPGAAGSDGFTGNLFFTFNNKLIFTADDGHGSEVWATDGTTANTIQLANAEEEEGAPSFDLITNAVKVGNKFIYPSSSFVTGRQELWESDGTPANTKRFKAFDGVQIPFNLVTYDYSGNGEQLLFHGNQFFFYGATANEGVELWISDGTLANTKMVKDILPGAGDGVQISAYIYTTTALFFAANDGVHGTELWKSDGTAAGTVMVKDINPGNNDADAQPFFGLVNGRVLFAANDGSAAINDLFAVDGTFGPLPIKLGDFTVVQKQVDALLQWHTEQEINSKDFTIQRSDDGINFSNIGKVNAQGNSNVRKGYSFTDVGIINSGKSIVYYRLLLNDIDGKSVTSAIVPLRINNKDAWQVKLLGNPVINNISLLLTNIKEPIQITITDISGKKYLTQSLPAASGQINIAANALAKGVYVLSIQSGSEQRVISFVK